MDKIIFVDFQTKIIAGWLNTVSDTVWDALGQSKTPQEARAFIGAVEEAPNDGKAYLRSNLSWLEVSLAVPHNDLGGRSISDAHPTSAITGLDASLSAKAPIDSPAFTGNPTAPTPSMGDNDTSIATTAFVKTALDNQSSSGMLPSDDAPLMNGVAFSGSAATGSRSDHIHPTDTSRAPSSAGTASGTSFTPSGTIASSTVQSAIQELDSETQAALGGKAPASAGTAAGTSFTPAGGIASTDVQAALVELDSELRSFRSGEVLQVVTHFDSGNGQSASGWVSLTSVAASITPKSANSTIIVECFANFSVANVANVNAQATFQIYSGSVPAGNIGNFISPRAPSGSGGVGIACGGALMASVANTALTTRSFALGGAPTTGIPNTIGGTQQAWKITEVQN